MNKLFDMCNTEENNNKRTIISRVENINDFFKLPILYNADKMAVDDHIITDLELIKTVINLEKGKKYQNINLDNIMTTLYTCMLFKKI